jgi:hypothetical protein
MDIIKLTLSSNVLDEYRFVSASASQIDYRRRSPELRFPGQEPNFQQAIPEPAQQALSSIVHLLPVVGSDLDKGIVHD